MARNGRQGAPCKKRRNGNFKPRTGKHAGEANKQVRNGRRRNKKRGT